MDSAKVFIKVDPPTSITEDFLFPHKFYLEQNYPNPFNPSTKISYQLNTQSHIQLTIYDISGREIKTLVKQSQIVGTHSINFDATGLASGVYIYKLKSDSF